MSFHNALRRLRAAASEPQPGQRIDMALVRRRDLQNLLADYDRVDSMARQQHDELAAIKDQPPAGWQARFIEPSDRWDAWSPCTKEHHDLVKRTPAEWPGYEVRPVFALPPAIPLPAPSQVAAEVLAEPARRKAPWPDYAGRDIYEGDTIQHPASGELGKVSYFGNFSSDYLCWRVDYDDGTWSSLSKQINEKGQAVVVTPRPTKAGE